MPSNTYEAIAADIDTESLEYPETEFSSFVQEEVVDSSGIISQGNTRVGLFNTTSGDVGGMHRLPPPASGWSQLRAMCWRQWLFKKRNSVQTSMELLSPVLMLSILVFGWWMSSPDHYDAAIFVNSSLPWGEKLKDAVQDSENFLRNCPPAKLLQKQLSAAQLDLLSALLRGGIVKGENQLPSFNLTGNTTTGNPLLQHELDTTVSPELLLLVLQCVDLAHEAISAADIIEQYNGPIQVPSFDTFVATHKFIKETLETRVGKLEDLALVQKAFGSVLGNLLQLGKIIFAPNTSEVGAMVDHMMTESQFFKDVYGGTFGTEKEAVEAALKYSEIPTWAVVIIDKLQPTVGKVDYTIRMNYTTVPRTASKIHRHHRGLITNYKQYYTSGFLTLQDTINSFALKDLPRPQAAKLLAAHPVWGAPFPVSEYTHNIFYDVVGPLMGLVMCLSTLWPVAMLVKALVEEKETRAKETMRIMGLKSWVFSLSWLYTYMNIFFIVSLSITVLLTSTYFPSSDPTIIFLLFLLFLTSLIPFGFFLAVFFSKSKLAAMIAPFVLFATILPRYIFFRSHADQALPGKSATSLLPPTAFTFGVDLMGQYEGAGVGITWANFLDDEFSFGWIFLLLIADSILYSLLAWYLEQVLPSEYGARLPPWFLFTSSYWNEGRPVTAAEYEMLPVVGDDCLQEEVEVVGGEDLHPAICIKDLKKVFPGGKVGVHGLNLSIYQDQITALLGHNGAGKSTTISMLTGLIRPTGGDAEIWGHSIRGNTNYIRRTIGVCPQQNVLFNSMTVKEHLDFYCVLKGVPKDHIGKEVKEMVGRLGLLDTMNCYSSSLSGGMKRKLQVAIAMIGGSRVVFLDEPTSGMDPRSRRAMWDLLRTFKTGRAIVLTTHYMDEADLLCDRIAIMSEGRLRCCGSSLYLKAKYGVGYNLTMTKKSSACAEAAVKDFIFQHLPQAVPLSSAGGEMAFQLPVANKTEFSELFRELETHKDALEIGGYGISMTTLEEVFLRLASEDTLTSTHSLSAQVPSFSRGGNNEPAEFPVSDSLTELNEESQRLVHKVAQEKTPSRAHIETMDRRTHTSAWLQMFNKRAIIARRDLKGLVNTILVPVAVIAFVMFILKLNINPSGPRLQLNFEMYQTPVRNMSIPVAGAALGGKLVEPFAQFEVHQEVKDSVEMSELLLSTMHNIPRYGAVVFNDTLLQQYNTSDFRSVNLTELKILFPNSSLLETLPFGSMGDLPFMQTQGGKGFWSPVTLLHNTSSDHAMPALIQEITQSRLRASLNNFSASFLVASHPLPLTKNEAMKIETYLTVLAALFLLVPFCYLGASFSMFVVRERAVKAKHLQMLSGANKYVYWTATYCWDMINYSVIVGATMLVFVAYRDESFIGSWTKAGAVLLLLMSFGLSVIPLTYCYAFGFTSHTNAQVAIAGIHFATGFVMLVASTVMGALENTKGINKFLMYIYQLFPSYNLGRGLVSLSALDLQTTFLGGTPHPYKWNVLGRPISLMLIEGAVYMFLTLTMDDNFDFLKHLGKLLQCVWTVPKLKSANSAGSQSFVEASTAEDIDVTNERKRVEGGLADQDAIRIHRLWKIYPEQGQQVAKIAVKDLCLGIAAGECFGFLGVNGAGKTTTLSILSGDIKPTSGDAFVNGDSILTNLKSARKQIGYCPQFDPLLDLMTGREQLHMYAILKGVPKRAVHSMVDEVLKAVGLDKYADTVARIYSGGNKRKLSLAIALVGNPAVVFLDEPSSGMDPVARRSMWDLIVDAVTERNVSIVLTTHSMEECEALCSRLGVMVDGRLVCLGSTQHLKSRFGQGYNVEMSCKRLEDVPQVKELMLHSFPQSVIRDEHLSRLKYSIPLDSTTLSQVFGILEIEKEKIGLDDYSVSQCTLEQIFLTFAGKGSTDYTE